MESCRDLKFDLGLRQARSPPILVTEHSTLLSETNVLTSVLKDFADNGSVLCVD